MSVKWIWNGRNPGGGLRSATFDSGVLSVGTPIDNFRIKLDSAAAVNLASKLLQWSSQNVEQS